MDCRALRKCDWPELNELSLRTHTAKKDENKILEGNSISKMNSKEKRKLNIEYLNYQNEQCNDISWIAKLETKRLTSLTVNCTKRI